MVLISAIAANDYFASRERRGLLRAVGGIISELMPLYNTYTGCWLLCA